MASQADVRRLALALPGAVEAADRFAFGVADRGKTRGFAWVWLERVHPKQARVPNPAVLGVRVDGPDAKAALLAGDPEKFFTEPHYDGYPAVLVRLAAVTSAELRELLAEAHRCVAPKAKAGPKAAKAAKAAKAGPKAGPKAAAPKRRRAKPR